jgi:acyl-CoA thioester hydrolase
MKYRNYISLRYSDSDQMGVVYHANYFTFFELGRTGMLKEYGVDYYKVEEKGFIFPVRDVDCTYLKSIKLGEKIYVESKIFKISKVKISFEHEIRNEENELKAVGHTSIVCVRKSDFKIAKLDKVLPEVYLIKENM